MLSSFYVWLWSTENLEAVKEDQSLDHGSGLRLECDILFQLDRPPPSLYFLPIHTHIFSLCKASDGSLEPEQQCERNLFSGVLEPMEGGF